MLAEKSKAKRIRYYVLKYDICLYFLIQQRLLISSEKYDDSITLGNNNFVAKENIGVSI